MIVSILVAADEAGGIGRDGRLPWHLPADLKRFKALTMGRAVILGRKTWESIGKPLPGRRMIVVTRQPGYQAPGCQSAGSLPEAVAIAVAGALAEPVEASDSSGGSDSDEMFVIGGGEIYLPALRIADRIYLTRVHARLPADTFFPSVDENLWVLTASEFHPADAAHAYAFTFQVFERKAG